MKKYIPKNIEPKWQKKWEESGLYKTDLAKPNKFYVLAEFAYPSGDLHMGHWFTFGGADIYARMKRMQGYNVFFPNGFDAFGLPAENAAIKRNIHPQDWTKSNIAAMKKQFKTTGASFTFDHEVITSLPNYYKWNQWIFIKMFEKGLAYKGKYISNWCETDQTVLANEGVVDGLCWRCGNPVVQKAVDQWFFKIKAYADRLIWPEDPNVNWPKSVREAQNQWIGKSEGIIIDFKLENSEEVIKAYTVYPETIFGVTYMVLAPEHPLATKIATPEYKQSVLEYLEKAKKKLEVERKEAEREKTGVFTGSYCINPANNKKFPIWIADYVIGTYGTGAVMGVPGSDKRDFEFAKKYELAVIRVIGKTAKDKDEIKSLQDVLEEGYLVNSGRFSGLKTPQPAKEQVKGWMENQGFGERSAQYHIHDWSISRQRYWGTPIPMVHCSKCGIVPVPEKNLPVELPYDVDYTPKGKSPLASNEAWLSVKCPKCGGDAKRDVDTMDTFVDSSWYFFRYLNPDLETKVFDIDLASKIMPVDIYFGGAEHTLGHTLYSRFFTKFFYDLRLTKLDEYALRRVNHGIVLGPDGNKMSKSKGNVVNPDDEVNKYGADAVRVYLAFFMPYEGTGPWISERIWGPYRFLERVWLLTQVKAAKPTQEGLYLMHKTIKKVTDDIEATRFNTAVAALMEWLNYLGKKKVSEIEYETFLKLLAPFAPHITEELWSYQVKAADDDKWSIHQQKWPEADEKYLQKEHVVIVVQVNGKLRHTLTTGNEVAEEETKVVKLALGNEKVKKYLATGVKKIIYIKGRLLNFVT
ncbi:leucine--tRNA ligase [Candidatus Daviesbacteria bacterium]|nr:leucine--tRNA ligase [Candidatus Daviesbacteria bacterium]